MFMNGDHDKGVNYDDDSYGGDDDDDDDRDSDDFVNDGNLHLLHWHKSTGQVGEQIILMQSSKSEITWINCILISNI